MWLCEQWCLVSICLFVCHACDDVSNDVWCLSLCLSHMWLCEQWCLVSIFLFVTHVIMWAMMFSVHLSLCLSHMWWCEQWCLMSICLFVCHTCDDVSNDAWCLSLCLSPHLLKYYIILSRFFLELFIAIGCSSLRFGTHWMMNMFASSCRQNALFIDVIDSSILESLSLVFTFLYQYSVNIFHQ